MKFYIEEDVDLPQVRRALTEMGHTVWHVSQAGRTGDGDSSQLAYAIDRSGVVITHDAAYTRAHKDMPIGRVITLKCREGDAADTLRKGLPDVLELLERKANVYIELKRNAEGVVTVRSTFGTESR